MHLERDSNPNPGQGHSGSAPLLTIIVSSYGDTRIDTALLLFDSIMKQSMIDFQLIWVLEDCPTLTTRLNGLISPSWFPRVVLICTNEKLGASEARNAAISHAHGSVIAFVDDDVILFPDWATQLVDAYRNPGVIGVSGAALPVFIRGWLSWMPREISWLVGSTDYLELECVSRIRNAWSMNMSFARTIFDKGLRFRREYGLHSDLGESWGERIPEDLDISLRAKRLVRGNIVFAPSVTVGHIVDPRRYTVQFLMKKAFNLGGQRKLVQIMYADQCADLWEERKAVAQLLVFVLKLPRGIVRSPCLQWQQFSIVVLTAFLAALGYASTSFFHRNTSSPGTLPIY